MRGWIVALACVLGCGSGFSTGAGTGDGGGVDAAGGGDDGGGPGPGPGPSDGGDADPPDDAAPSDVIPIRTLRDPAAPGHPGYGATAAVRGVVTGVKSTGNTHGFFLQDANASAWAGIFVFVNTSTVAVARGDVVRARGVYKQYRGFDQLDTFLAGNDITRLGTGAVPPALVVPVADIAVGGARAKELQSMLLRVTNVEATTTTTQVDFLIRQIGSAGPEIPVTSFIANDAGPSPFPVTAGKTFTAITGFGYHAGSTDQNAIPKLAPLTANDLQ